MSSSHCSTKSKDESHPNNDRINANPNSYNDYLDNLESERERERRSKLLDIINWLQQRHHDNRVEFNSFALLACVRLWKIEKKLYFVASIEVEYNSSNNLFINSE
uniref:Uncharacterized protein n=1 Tax=Glossina austeni TaxID=7395 RepID=A0A1A9UPK4_GLOAU